MTVRFCRSCGATSAEAAFPPKEAGKLAPKLCVECARATGGGPRFAASRTIITRASYRAALRYRRKSAQGDLVDLIVPPP